jgi:hypothetical protein
MSTTGAAAGAAPDPDSPVPIPVTSPSTRTRPLSAFWQDYAFSLGGIDFLQIDVALAAMVFGEWARFERRLTEGLACVACATADDRLPQEAAIDEAIKAFRYEHDLISGADVSAWLDRSAISTEAWTASVTRGLLRQLWRDEIEGLLDRYGPSPRQLEAAALAEGVCSGLFDEFEQSFCGRAAIAFESDRSLFESREQLAGSHADAATRFARQHAHWLEGCPAADTLARLRVVLRIHSLFCVASEQVASEASLLEVIEANRLEWVVIETDTLSFADENAAREAMFCVTEDRLSLADVSGLAKQPLIREHGFLADVPAEYRHRLLAAEPGRVIGPLHVDGRFQVTVVTGRAAPTLADGRVAQRARALLLEDMARRAARDHVRRRTRAPTIPD